MDCRVVMVTWAPATQKPVVSELEGYQRAIELIVAVEFGVVERDEVAQGRSSDEFVNVISVREDNKRASSGRVTRVTRSRP